MDALLKAYDRGLEVRVVTDSDNLDNPALVELKSEGIIKGDEDHKFFVIDNRTVITGFFNSTRHANKDNDENILIIHSSIIAELYASSFIVVTR